MENPALGSGNNNGNQAAARAERPIDARRLNVERHVGYLLHAVHCHDDDCSLPSCQRMKHAIQHIGGCNRRRVCTICKSLLALCAYHAKDCQENICPVPFCTVMKPQIHLQRMQNAQRRRRSKTVNRG